MIPFGGALELVTVRLDVSSSVAGELERRLTFEERQRARRLVFERDRRRFIVRRGRLRQLLGARLGVRPEAVELDTGPGGKPELAWGGTGAGLRFSVSHTGDVASYAFTRGRDVGIDIETVRAWPEAEDIAALSFSPSELEVWRTIPPKDKPLAFSTWWTRKEAFVKATGDGLSRALDNFDVTFAPDEPARILRVGDSPGDDCGWRLRAYSPGPGLIGAVVVQELAMARR
jgi:4'-phosphopantetheinyl transferase